MRSGLRLSFLVILLAACLLNQAVSHCQSREEELRGMLTVAFEAVAEAEGKGGDVSHLVDELSRALRLIEAGGAVDLDTAQSVIEGVLSAAPGVEQQGVASTRLQQVKAVAIISLLAVSGIVVWRYGPRVFWTLWLRSKRDWIVRS